MAEGLKTYLIYIVLWLLFMALIGFLAWLTPRLAKAFYKKTGKTPKYTTYAEPKSEEPDEKGENTKEDRKNN